MTLQARLSRPALCCIVRSMEAVLNRFCKTGAGIKYLTRYPQEGRSSAYKFSELYGFYSLELQSLSSVKVSDTGLETLKTNRRAPASIGGLFMLVTWQSLLLSMGCCYWEAERLIRDLLDGVSSLIATPAPRLETESGNQGNLIGGFYYA